MIYTTDKHLGAKLGFLFVLGVLVVLIAYLVSVIYPLFGFPNDYEIGVDVALWIPLTIIVVRLMDKYADWFATYHVNKDLRTPISWDEARQVSFIFSGHLEDGQWYPMKQIRDLPEEQRRPYLFNFARETAERVHSGKLIT